jgi:lipopolysaccharide biosynthesis regulator YciM
LPDAWAGVIEYGREEVGIMMKDAWETRREEMGELLSTHTVRCLESCSGFKKPPTHSCPACRAWHTVGHPRVSQR